LWWLTGPAGKRLQPTEPLVKDEYFDLQALSAFAIFEDGLAVSTASADT
jgi:hypothetical protein